MFAATVSESSFIIGNLDHTWERIQTHEFPKLRLPEAPRRVRTQTPQVLSHCAGVRGVGQGRGLTHAFACCIGKKSRASWGNL